MHLSFFKAACLVLAFSSYVYGMENQIILKKGGSFATSQSPTEIRFYKDTAYVLNLGDETGSVTVQSLTTNQLITTIEVGKLPISPLMTSDKLIIINTGNLTLSVIDVLQNKLFGTYVITTGKSPSNDLKGVLGEGGHFLYVTNPVNNTVEVFDTKTFAKKTTIAVGKCPYDILYTNEKLYVCNYEGNSVSVIDVNPASNFNNTPIATYGALVVGSPISAFTFEGLPINSKVETGKFVGIDNVVGLEISVLETTKYAIPRGSFRDIPYPIPNHHCFTTNNGTKYFVRSGNWGTTLDVCVYKTKKVVQRIVANGNYFNVRQDLKKVFVSLPKQNQVQWFSFD